MKAVERGLAEIFVPPVFSDILVVAFESISNSSERL